MPMSLCRYRPKHQENRPHHGPNTSLEARLTQATPVYLSQSPPKLYTQNKTPPKWRGLSAVWRGPKAPFFCCGSAAQRLNALLAAADRATNRVEACAHIVAKTGQRGDQHNSDQGCDQAIFDGSRPRFALTKLLQKLFQRSLPSDMQAQDDIF